MEASRDASQHASRDLIAEFVIGVTPGGSEAGLHSAMAETNRSRQSNHTASCAPLGEANLLIAHRKNM